jgi:hypothetical protein
MFTDEHKQTQLTTWHRNFPTEARSYWTVHLDVSRCYVTPIATCPHLPLHSTHNTHSYYPISASFLFPRGFRTTTVQGFIVSIRRGSVPSALFAVLTSECWISTLTFFINDLSLQTSSPFHSTWCSALAATSIELNSIPYRQSEPNQGVQFIVDCRVIAVPKW